MKRKKKKETTVIVYSTRKLTNAQKRAQKKEFERLKKKLEELARKPVSKKVLDEYERKIHRMTLEDRFKRFTI